MSDETPADDTPRPTGRWRGSGRRAAPKPARSTPPAAAPERVDPPPEEEPRATPAPDTGVERPAEITTGADAPAPAVVEDAPEPETDAVAVASESAASDVPVTEDDAEPATPEFVDEAPPVVEPPVEESEPDNDAAPVTEDSALSDAQVESDGEAPQVVARGVDASSSTGAADEPGVEAVAPASVDSAAEEVTQTVEESASSEAVVAQDPAVGSPEPQPVESPAPATEHEEPDAERGESESESESAAPVDLDAQLAQGAREMGVELDATTRRRMLAYQEALLDETTRVNLTGIRDPQDAVVRHLLDSVSVLPAWESLRGRPPRRVLDLGTGGGVPGAILAALWPRTRALLVDGTRKKLDAVDRCLAHAEIENADTLHSRGKDVVRELPAARRAFDLCVARAVGRCPKLLDELRHLVAPGGLIFLMKGPQIDADERAATERKAGTLRFSVLPDIIAQVPGLEPRRILVFERRR